MNDDEFLGSVVYFMFIGFIVMTTVFAFYRCNGRLLYVNPQELAALCEEGDEETRVVGGKALRGPD